MHTLTISLQGVANDTTNIELGDADALPVYVKLKEVLLAAKAPRKASKKDAAAPAPGASNPSANGDQTRALSADADTGR
ncbi:MAG: hypothetical protein ABIT01_07075 [Thermoanaerobaculia bacterium]